MATRKRKTEQSDNDSRRATTHEMLSRTTTDRYPSDVDDRKPPYAGLPTTGEAARFTAVQVNSMHADHDGSFWFKLYRDGEPVRQDGKHVQLKANGVEHAVQCAEQVYGTSTATVPMTKSDPKPLKDDVDMSVITRTNFTCDGDDADTINDMYMVLTRFLKIGSGDAKLVKDGGDVIDRYKGKRQ